ncbi:MULTISPECIES: hypothetical protein [Streptomyces]|uniref:Chemotaxis protein histidine kinase CheA n=1 Tax=Streptomyces stelliscabiei TaxID=146820 RepID=A0A8I0P3H0_9ACTN|nr:MULTISPECIES: hypothetical protein [Streptomyces]KND43133.1 regulatory protein [Streptomyces stelliscabiei]MBE1594693.1 chemotaxis protein histidine kinase CheA [Streptomyces stelliscabiei]MDX2518976.1 hypothetical protein [Streptomyces stelliscabiei]MDX2550833.1 hypothetical protein [Streptomyces stelliscabiei]MDX2616685.1 hypothetical protein [Streptomyces stelliscabiei]
MTETPSETTDLKAQYTAQVAADLERNTKEQERLHGEIDALQEQLRNLQHDHSVLANVQQALGFVTPETAPAAEEVLAAPVPRQKTAPTPSATKRTRAKRAEKVEKAAPAPSAKQAKKPAAAKTAAPKTAATKTAAAKTAAPKSATSKAAASKSTASKAAATKSAAPKKDQPTLVELIRRHLIEQSEPRSAAEVAAALTQAHPDRRIQTNVVRTTLEGLVAKSNAQRSRQGSSVYYTAPDAPEQSAAPSQAEAEPASANA